MKATYLLCQLFVSGISYQERNAGTYGVSVGGELVLKIKAELY